jgi:hypothetical protein
VAWKSIPDTHELTNWKLVGILLTNSTTRKGLQMITTGKSKAKVALVDPIMADGRTTSFSLHHIAKNR